MPRLPKWTAEQHQRFRYSFAAVSAARSFRQTISASAQRALADGSAIGVKLIVIGFQAVLAQIAA